jgi:hypothetical protein
MNDFPNQADFLLEWEIPMRIRSQRYGVCEFHHPEIVEAIGELSPEERLRELIEYKQELFETDLPLGPVKESQNVRVAWEGTATQLEMQIRRDGNMRFEADKLFNTSKSCSMYLSKLTKKYPRRFKKLERRGNFRPYRIEPPDIA